MHTKEELDAICELYCDTNNTITLNYTICTEDYFVDCNMVPKRIKELGFLVPVTVFLLFILLTGLLGNLSVCTVIKKHPNMRTDTNVYLFSLAVSDILLLIFGLAPELWYYWQMYPYIFGEFTCKISSFLAATATWASALTVVAFSIERYTAICHQSSFNFSRSRVALALFAIWTVSVAVSLPTLLIYGVVPLVPYEPLGDDAHSLLSTKCTVTPEQAKYAYHDQLYTTTCVLFFFVPMVILTFIYIKIGIFIRNNRKLARKSGINNSCAENSNVTKVLVAVVVVFFCCGAPFHFQRLITTSKPENREYERTVLMITGLFYYASAAINPILYNIWCKRYRKAFKEIINIGTKKQNQNIRMDQANYTNGSKKSTNATTTYTTQISL